MTHPEITGQDAASVAVLQYQQTALQQQMQTMQQQNGDGLQRIYVQLEKLSEMSAQLAAIQQRQEHQSESLARAHSRLDVMGGQLSEHITDSGAWRETAQAKLDAKIAPVIAEQNLQSRTMSRWHGTFLGVQAVVVFLISTILWVANGYIEKIDGQGERIIRLERTIDKSIPTEVKVP